MGSNKKLNVGACKSYCMNFDYFKIVDLVLNLRKKESMDLELARVHVSKFYWWIAIRSRAWGLVSLIV